MIHLFLSLIQGPIFPKALQGHSSLTLGNDLIVFGGLSDASGGWHYSSSIYKMSCNNGQFSQWIELEVQLKTPRGWFVASFIPNDLIDFQSTP